MAVQTFECLAQTSSPNSRPPGQTEGAFGTARGCYLKLWLYDVLIDKSGGGWDDGDGVGVGGGGGHVASVLNHCITVSACLHHRRHSPFKAPAPESLEQLTVSSLWAPHRSNRAISASREHAPRPEPHYPLLRES